MQQPFDLSPCQFDSSALRAGRCNRGMRERLVRPEPEGPERFFTPMFTRVRDGGVIDVSRPYRGARASAPRNAAVSPSSDSMRKSWLYLATRSDRHGARS